MNKKGASQESLNNVDAEISELIDNDLNRQNTHIHLIASENFASKAVMEASGSILTNKYSEGFPGRRYYEGCEIVCLLYTSPSPRDLSTSRMPSSA